MHRRRFISGRGAREYVRTAHACPYVSQSPRRAGTRSGDARGVFARVAVAARLLPLNRDLSGAPMPHGVPPPGGGGGEVSRDGDSGNNRAPTRCITGSREIIFVAARTLLPRLCNYQGTSFRRE